MSHFLTTNWTEKIKTNPVANLLLNSNRVRSWTVTTRHLTHVPAKGHITPSYIKQHSWDIGLGFKDERAKNELLSILDSELEFRKRFNAHRDSIEQMNKLGMIIPPEREQGIGYGYKGFARAKDGGKDGVMLGDGMDNNGGDVAVGTGPKKKYSGDKLEIDDDGMERKENENDEYDDFDVSAPPLDSDTESVVEDDELKHAESFGYEDEEYVGGDMWANMYVKDFINIHHPKNRVHAIDNITRRPLHIKPPSVFFSDV